MMLTSVYKMKNQKGEMKVTLTKLTPEMYHVSKPEFALTSVQYGKVKVGPSGLVGLSELIGLRAPSLRMIPRSILEKMREGEDVTDLLQLIKQCPTDLLRLDFEAKYEIRPALFLSDEDAEMVYGF